VRDEEDDRRSEGALGRWEVTDVFSERLSDDAVTGLRVVCGVEADGERACPRGCASGSRLGGAEDLPERTTSRRERERERERVRESVRERERHSNRTGVPRRALQCSA